jgi:hypothetical protein
VRQVFGDISTQPPIGCRQLLGAQYLVGREHGVARHPELPGEDSRRGKLFSRVKAAVQDRAPENPGELLVKRTLAVQFEVVVE